MGGDKIFCNSAQKLVFGSNYENISSIQSLSGTGSLYIGAIFLKHFWG